MRLFLSYSRKDRLKVDELASLLRLGGHEVWIDDAIRVGDDWQSKLREAIETTDGMVLAITPHWIQSTWCQWEFMTATEMQKKIIPVLMAQTDLPDRLTKYQFANFTTGFDNAPIRQRFLDDLHSLAVAIPSSDSVIADKSNLAEQINQAISTGNITQSTVDIRQILESLPSGNKSSSDANQKVQMGDISGSTITISNQTQITTPAEKTRNWTPPVIISLVLLFIVTLVTIIATLPENSRNGLLTSIGLLSPTEMPTLLPTATPEPLSASGFNVVVAGFGFQTANGVIERSKLADDMSDIVANELNQITQIDNTLGWRRNGVGHILGETQTEREAQAAQIANLLNADVVVYGIVREDGIFNVFEPEFYITAEFASIEPELIGADSLGSSVEFVGNSEDQILAANTFQRRLTVMRFFLRGLAFYLNANFEGARASFEEALTIESEGLEVLYIFAGNAAIRVPDTDKALSYYNSALQIRPEYARALVGRGIVLYRKAQEIAGRNPPPYNPALTLSASQTCYDDTPIPTVPQLLGLLALRCYQEASISKDQPPTADIDVKVAFGLGQTNLWLSLNEYGDNWEQVEQYLTFVTDAYKNGTPDRQARIRATSAHANAWRGLRLLSIDSNNSVSVCKALNFYRDGVGLLRLDVNRTYNQNWIDLYGQQVGALEDWLSQRNYTCELSEQLPESADGA